MNGIFDSIKLGVDWLEERNAMFFTLDQDEIRELKLLYDGGVSVEHIILGSLLEKGLVTPVGPLVYKISNKGRKWMEYYVYN